MTATADRFTTKPGDLRWEDDDTENPMTLVTRTGEVLSTSGAAQRQARAIEEGGQAIGMAFPSVPGFKGQGWSTQETMMIVRWLFDSPGAWDQAMSTAREYPGNPHTVADTLHEHLVPRSELDAIAAAGGDPAKVNWLEIAHELIERRADPLPAQEHGISAQAAMFATISGQLIDLASRPWLPAKEYWAGVDAGTTPKAKFAKTSTADLVAHADGTVTSKKTKAVIGRGLAHENGGKWVATHADGSVTRHGSKQAALSVMAGRHNKAGAVTRAVPPPAANTISAQSAAPAVKPAAAKSAPVVKAIQKPAPAAPSPATKAPGVPAAATLNAALKSGVTSRTAPGSKKVALSQGKEGTTRVVTFNNGSQYIQKDFKGMTDNRPPALGGTGGLMPPEQQRRQVAKEILASKISKAIGAGAPDIMGDPDSPSGLYEPKIAGVSAVEHFKAGKKGMAEMFRSPKGAKIGLMDAVTGNEDRHMGNVMVSPDGEPIPIDHNDTWGAPDFDGGLFTDSPFTDALYKQIDAGKSPFTTADLDQVKAGIQALKPEFEAMPGGGGAKNFQMTMDKLAQIRGRVAGQ